MCFSKIPMFPCLKKVEIQFLGIFLFIKWILVRLGGLAHGIVTKTVHKTLPEGNGGEGF